MSMHEYVLDELRKSRGRWPSIAREANVSYRTLQKIAQGQIVDPGVSQIERLNNYFRAATHDESRA